jgi:hypothetical protein
LLVVVEPSEEFSDADVQGMLHWVEEGNTLVLLGRDSTALHAKLGIELHGDAEAFERGETTELVPNEAGAYTEGMEHIVVEGSDTIEAGRGLPLWSIGGRPAALIQRWGQGRVVVAADPSLLTSRGMRRGDNVLFLYNLARVHAGDGRVYFDEYHHGLYSGGGFWGYLRYHDQLWTVLAVFIAAAVAAWAVAVRLGSAVAPLQTDQADAVAYASAVARIYQLAGLRRLMGQMLANHIMTQLRRLLGLRPDPRADDERVAWQLLEQEPAIRELRRGVGELRGNDVTDRQLLAWVRVWDRFRSEVPSARTR